MPIYLVRHGETALNAARVLQPAATPLSERGHAQAQAVAGRLAALTPPVAAIVCSDMPRAVQTAEAIAAATGAPVHCLPDLQERNFGDLRGRPYDAFDFDPLAMEAAPPGGESADAFRRRVAQAFAAVLALRAQVAGPLAVVTHGLVIRALLASLPRAGVAETTVGNTALTVLDPAPPHAVSLFGCVAHLDGLPPAAPHASMAGGLPGFTQPETTTMNRHITFFHALQSRSAGVRILLEELEADYEVHLLDLQAGATREPTYLAINPMGKVPAIKHGDAIVTEQPAVYQYLAELYPEKGLAPMPGDPLRGPFLRWLAFYGASFEPALIDRAMKREPAAMATSPYGDYDTMLGTLIAQLEPGPYMLGERYTAADVLWGTALKWTTMFKLVPEHPVLQGYMDRVGARPAAARAAALDAALAPKSAA